MRHKTDFVHIKRTRNRDEGSKAKNKNSKSVQHYSNGIFTELCLTHAGGELSKCAMWTLSGVSRKDGGEPASLFSCVGASRLVSGASSRVLPVAVRTRWWQRVECGAKSLISLHTESAVCEEFRATHATDRGKGEQKVERAPVPLTLPSYFRVSTYYGRTVFERGHATM
jgi:hypothetical protein